MERVRGCDHQSIKVERQQLVERAGLARIGRKFQRLRERARVRVANADCCGMPASEHRLHAIAADPPRSEKAQPHHGTTTALTKLPGRSRVASRAAPSRSSG